MMLIAALPAASIAFERMQPLFSQFPAILPRLNKTVLVRICAAAAATDSPSATPLITQTLAAIVYLMWSFITGVVRVGRSLAQLQPLP